MNTPQDYCDAVKAIAAATAIKDRAAADLKPVTPTLSLTVPDPNTVVVSSGVPVEAGVEMEVYRDGSPLDRRASSEDANYLPSGGWGSATFKVRLVRVVQDETTSEQHDIFGDWSNEETATEP